MATRGHVGISREQIELGGAKVFAHLPRGWHRQSKHNDGQESNDFAQNTAADFHSNSSEGFL
jgi:hypothetical protein